MSLNTKSALEDLTKSDERSRLARVMKDIEFRKPFIKLPQVCMNSHSGAVWNDIQKVWQNGAWIATVVMCDMFCQNQIRGLYRNTFNVEPSDDYTALVQNLCHPKVRVLTAKTGNLLLDLAKLKRYYDQPFGTPMVSNLFRVHLAAPLATHPGRSSPPPLIVRPGPHAIHQTG